MPRWAKKPDAPKGSSRSTRFYRAYVSQLEPETNLPTVDSVFRICDPLEMPAMRVIKQADAARKWKSASNSH